MEPILNVGIHLKALRSSHSEVFDFQTLLLLQVVIIFGQLLLGHPDHRKFSELQSDSKLLSGFPWPIILKSEKIK
jgi:hypothetical protein